MPVLWKVAAARIRQASVAGFVGGDFTAMAGPAAAAPAGDDPSDGGPDLTAAVKRQLGLRLVARRRSLT
jgi:hypothetical protein